MISSSIRKLGLTLLSIASYLFAIATKQYKMNRLNRHSVAMLKYSTWLYFSMLFNYVSNIVVTRRPKLIKIIIKKNAWT